MKYRIEFGVPEFKDFIIDLKTRYKNDTLNKREQKLFKQLIKAILFLESNHFHNGLHSHEIDDLSKKFSKQCSSDIKVYQSYLENNTPGAGRLYWVYGPVKGVITIIGSEPHPEDSKKSGYAKVKLSNLPTLLKKT